MPRKKGTHGSNSPKKEAGAFPTGLQTNEGVSEESAWSDYPDSFFTEGVVRTLPGTCNILIVAPNLSPDTDDKNIVLLTYRLAEALGAHAVTNCRCYRRPIEGDPTPEELQSSRTGKT